MIARYRDTAMPTQAVVNADQCSVISTAHTRPVHINSVTLEASVCSRDGVSVTMPSLEMIAASILRVQATAPFR